MTSRPCAALILAAALWGCGCSGGGARGPATSDDGAEVMRYAADAFAGRWQISSRFKTRPGAALQLDAGAEITLRFVSVAPGTLEIFIEELAITGHMGGQPIDQRLSDDDPAMAAVFAPWLSRMTMDEHGAVSGVRNPDSQLAQQGADLIDTAIFLIPPTPARAITVGAEWTAARIVPTSSDVPDVTADIAYRLTAIEPCAAPLVGRCATVASTTDTGERTLQIDGQDTRLRYTLEGESVLQLGGALGRSTARMTMLMTTAGMALELDGEMSYQRAISAP